MLFLFLVEREIHSVKRFYTVKLYLYVYSQDVCEQPGFSKSPDDYNHRFRVVRMDKLTA